jgi:alkylation response protein AidB-like acyl-CoA dehydrogenase
MNFGFTEEQTLLRDQVQRFMQEACPLSTVRSIADGDDIATAALWKQAADLGWLGMIVPQSLGGIGLKWVDMTVVLEEAGRGLCPLALGSHALSCAALERLATGDQCSHWLPVLAAGEARCTLGLFDDPNWIHPDAITLEGSKSSDGIVINGVKPFVPDAKGADYLLLALKVDGKNKLAALGKDQVTITEQPTMDTTKPMAAVSIDSLTLAEEFVYDLSDEDLTWLADTGAVAVMAEAVGAADRVLSITSEYAKDRIQFGKPIGQYQGVKHRLADMYVDVESMRSLTYYAAWTVDDAPEELSRAISLAKGYGSDAFAEIGIDGVGLHGAIGFTAEYDVQLYLKRSKWTRPMYGDSDFHLERVAALGGL